MLIFELILLAIAIVVSYMTVAQDLLQQQVSKLNTLSDMNRALRTTLEIDTLMGMIYQQVAELLNVQNLHILLAEEVNPAQYRLAYAAEGGIPIKRETPGSWNDMVRFVIDRGESLVADPLAATAQRYKMNNIPHARAWMGVPLRSGNRTVGGLFTWLGMNDQLGRSFTENDGVMFSAIGSQISATLENALLYELAQRHAAQLARLNQISTVMNASLNPERVLELVAESVIDVAGCDKAAIYLLETNSTDPSLLLTYSQGFSPEHIVRSRDIAVPLTDQERKQVMEDGQIIAVSNVRDEFYTPSPLTILLAERENFASYAYLPLRAQKQPIGMLAVYYNIAHDFDPSETELLATFANQAALAVANARVYQRIDIQLARRVEQIVHMADINQRLTSSLNMETVFGLIIDSAMEGLNANRGVLVLTGNDEIGQDSSGLNMVAWRGFDAVESMRMPHHVAEELAESPVLTAGETVLISQDDVPAAGPRSQLSIPITLEEKVIGAIALESEVLNAFSQDDVTFVNQLAVQASVAIRNAQLYKRAQIVRDRLHAILDASNDGLLMVDAKSRIVMTNSRMSEFWDFARDDAAPRSPDQFLADPLTALGEGLGYKEGELSVLLEDAIRKPDKRLDSDLYVTKTNNSQRQRFVERSVARVHDEEGSFIGLLLIFRDVTRQKELEQTREDLTNMIVHDLRSPLQAVMGSMRLIGEVGPKDNPIVEQATQVSGRAVKKLLNLVNNLLDLSRLERGEFVLDPAPEDVKSILEDAVQELMPLAQEMDAVIRVEGPDNLPNVNVDRDMIGRVILNLVDNALKYSPPGTLVSTRAAVIWGDEARKITGKTDAIIRVDVRDTGPGVPEQYRESIFDRYTQIPGQKGRRASAGLGLSFCKIAIQSHRGIIWCESNTEADNGSVFSFTLPIAPSIQPPPAPDPQEKATPDKPAPPTKSDPDPLATITDLPASKEPDGKPASTKAATTGKSSGAKPPASKKPDADKKKKPPSK